MLSALCKLLRWVYWFEVLIYCMQNMTGKTLSWVDNVIPTPHEKLMIQNELVLVCAKGRARFGTRSRMPGLWCLGAVAFLIQAFSKYDMAHINFQYGKGTFVSFLKCCWRSTYGMCIFSAEQCLSVPHWSIFSANAWIFPPLRFCRLCSLFRSLKNCGPIPLQKWTGFWLRSKTWCKRTGTSLIRNWGDGYHSELGLWACCAAFSPCC